MPNKTKNEFTRRVEGMVGGKLLKEFDRYCADEEMKEGEGMRSIFQKFFDAKHKKNPFFETDKK